MQIVAIMLIIWPIEWAVLQKPTLALVSFRSLSFCASHFPSSRFFIPHLIRGMMSSDSRDLSAAAPPSVWIWIRLPKTQSVSATEEEDVPGEQCFCYKAVSDPLCTLQYPSSCTERMVPSLHYCITVSLLTLWQRVHTWPQAPEVWLPHCFISRDPLLRFILKFRATKVSAIKEQQKNWLSSLRSHANVLARLRALLSKYTVLT